MLLLTIGAILTMLWGIGHLFPTASIVKGFGEISRDNKRIIRMEWINEGFTLIFIGALILIVTFLGDKNSATQNLVYLTSAIMLFTMAILSLFTGFNLVAINTSLMIERRRLCRGLSELSSLFHLFIMSLIFFNSLDRSLRSTFSIIAWKFVRMVRLYLHSSSRLKRSNFSISM